MASSSTKPTKPSVATAGPWKMDENANVYAVADEGVTLIAYIYHQGSAEAYGRANAKLIAKTPELKQVLKQVLTNWNNNTDELKQRIQTLLT